MSAAEVAERFCDEIGTGYRFAVVNFANADMVGHTGSIPAVVAAVEAADRSLGRVVECVQAAGGVALVTADHGNAEVMLEPDGVSPHTAHTANPVPLVVTDETFPLREKGELSDLAPTILAMLGISVPTDMTGKTLVMQA
jgi:2,3-bisphosphoglycerate-independent phosphoglycerate mutase